MWAGRGEEKGAALDFSEISLAADSGAFWGYRENLQGVSVEYFVTSFLTFTFCDKNRYNECLPRVCWFICSSCSGVIYFFLQTSPHTHISSSIQVPMNGSHSYTHTHTHTHPMDMIWRHSWKLLAADAIQTLFIRMLFIILTQILY